MGLFSIQQRFGAASGTARILVGLGLAAIGLAILAFVVPLVESRSLWLLALANSAVVLSVGRLALGSLLDDEFFRRRILVYGAGKRASTLLRLRRRSDQRGFRILGFVPAPGDEPSIDDDRLLDVGGASLFDMATSVGASEIVVAPDDRRRHFPLRDLLRCKFSGIDVMDLLAFLERETGRVTVDLVNPAWMIFSDGFSRANRIRIRIRIRLFDLLLSTLALLPALPLMAIVGVAILIDSRGPLLYRQRRVGLHGKEFILLKFRSMQEDAEAEGRPVWASRADKRVTRVGAVLRRLRLDELPQIFNVLRGDMSLVGPRPERPEFVAKLVREIPYYHERHYVKPGLTGWAQLCYPYGASEMDALAKLEYDIFYIKNRTLILDMVILLRTAEVVLWQKGAR